MKLVTFSSPNDVFECDGVRYRRFYDKEQKPRHETAVLIREDYARKLIPELEAEGTIGEVELLDFIISRIEKPDRPPEDASD